MVTRLLCAAALLALALTAPACGETCGRGRCDEGTCVSVLGRSTTLGTWGDWSAEHYPRTDTEFWCAVPCNGKTCPGGGTIPGVDGGVSTAGACLQDPADTSRVVCATVQAPQIEYFHKGTQVEMTTGSTPSGDGFCTGFSGYRVVNPQGSAVATCQANVACTIPPQSTGSQVPIRVSYDQIWNWQMIELLPARLTPPYPAGERLRIYTATDCEEIPTK
jgi:hypothetical protein